LYDIDLGDRNRDLRIGDLGDDYYQIVDLLRDPDFGLDLTNV
jgi:hypothetical protein